MTTTKSTPLTDAALAELDRLHEAAIKGMNWQEVAQFQAMITEQYQPIRQRLTDAESRLAEAERDELEALRHRIDSLQEAYNGVVRIIRNLDRDALCDWHDEFSCEEYLAAWLTDRDAQQRREGAVEAYERAADMLSVFPGGADAEEMMRDAAKRLREGK